MKASEDTWLPLLKKVILSVAISYVHDFQDAPISLLISIFIPFEGKILQQFIIVMRICSISFVLSFHSIQHNLHSCMVNNLYISLINTRHKPHSSTMVHKVAHTNPIPHVNFMFTISIQTIHKHTLEHR